MVEKEIGNGFRWHIAMVSGMGSHNVSKDMNSHANELASCRVKVETMQDEAEEGLGILLVQSTHLSIGRCIPLKEIALWTQICIL